MADLGSTRVFGKLSVTNDLSVGKTLTIDGVVYTQIIDNRIDSRVDKAFVDALNVDADTLDGNDSTAFATSAQGGLADSAVQPTDSVTTLSDVTSAGSGAIITSTERNKLDGIEAGAEVNLVDSVNGETGAVVLDSDDIDEGATNFYYTPARLDSTLLAGDNINITFDGTNVTIAGTVGDQNIDGGSASAVYTPEQVLDAEGA